MINQLLNILANAYVNLPSDHALGPVFQQLPVLLRTMSDLHPPADTGHIMAGLAARIPYISRPNWAILDLVMASQDPLLRGADPNAHLTHPKMDMRLNYLKCEFFYLCTPKWLFQATANVCSYIHDDVRIAFLNEKLEATEQTVKIIAALQPITVFITEIGFTAKDFSDTVFDKTPLIMGQ